MRILHVDDSSEDRELIRYRLQKLDSEIEIVWADNVSKALELASSEEFDCILSDYQMPSHDGLSFLTSLRNTGNETPFIFLTGQGNEGVAANAFKAGADDYYTKDLEISQFARIINSMKNLKNARKYYSITQKFRTQLAEINERFMIFTEASRDGLIIHNKGNISLVNSSLAEMAGTQEYNLIGHNLLELFPPEEHKKLKTSLISDFEKPFICRLSRTDGTHLFVEIHGKAIASGNKSYHVIVVRNLNDQVRLENELERSRKNLEHHTTMLRSLAVKLKKPARVMESFFQMLKSDLDISKNKKHSSIAGEMERISRDLFELSQELSDYLWISKKELCRSRFNLSDLFYNCLETMKSELKGTSVQSNVENNVNVNADRQLLEIAFKGLLDNVRKFKYADDSIEIGFGSITMEGKQVIYLCDNGLGFDCSLTENIFEPFTQLHNKTLFQGHGLGLTKAKLIVEKHGGSIWSESTPGHGSTFFFTLRADE